MTGVNEHTTPVLIVGGGVSGLSAALFLARQGVRATLVERHPTESIVPKARAFNPRTMEIYRGYGMEAEIRERQSYLADLPEMIGADSLAGEERFRFDLSAHVQSPSGVSPTDWAAIDQDELERLLRAHAVAAGADIRFGTELVSFDATADGVSAVARDLDSGSEYRIDAAYLVAADGHRAGIRKKLGIGADEALPPGRGAYIIFEADLTEALRGRRFILAYLDQPAPGTALVPVGENRWTIGFAYAPGIGEREEDFTEQHCVDLTRRAIGLSDVDITLLPPFPGRPEKVAHSTAGSGAVLADRFREGRVFLVGDAAHVVPPSGSYGASTGIADAHNLAWKLTAVLRSHAGPALLDTYEAERRPVARTTLDHTLKVLQARGTGSAEDNAAVDDITMMFGYRYDSAAVQGSPAAGSVRDPRTATGEPGLRAPHVWLERAGNRFSTTELCTEFWALLVGPDGDWTAAEAVATELGIDLRTYRVGAELRDPEDRFLASYGLTRTGASLVRPDGFVAWRAPAEPDDADAELRQALTTLLAR
ncbi:FAD-dependent oxidoreductase [Amycolatopsis sp. CA-230715]|uniref:FAD-dependent oxidoreductase n=1 Tax=Amycolatopsis sp. CA-230715 TaxID=2745196 RepID=UPI001C037D64|nr:FAD-dependent oxidoreductase [Amycolatopsis sp. CA-230715]QWF85357.1 Aklavinone 12-hydroxylase RdmE [Amycolatopsis sp. CA-230715]